MPRTFGDRACDQRAGSQEDFVSETTAAAFDMTGL
jgi:hypothetical protein